MNIVSLAQNNSIKDFNFKNYKAPDIKYRTLELGSNFLISGYQKKSDNNSHHLGINALLNYYQYINTSKHQETTNTSLSTAYYTEWGKQNEDKIRESAMDLNFDYSTDNRLYYKKNIFLGLHGYFDMSYNPAKSNSDDDKIKTNNTNLYISPTISVGKGRIEPIFSARKAVDILLSLQKNNRLKYTPNQSTIDSLSIIINQLQYERFFDSRLKRISQLEKLDIALQEMNLISDVDMVYFSNLNDIWGYAYSNYRGSGNRVEFGITPVYVLNYTKNDMYDVPMLMETTDQNYGLYGGIEFKHERPISYVWQSDIISNLTIGYAKEKLVDAVDSSEDTSESSSIKGLLNVEWHIGYYPNTRTYAGIAPFVSVSLNNEQDIDNEIWGLNTGVRLNTYYYVSPKLRLNLYAGLLYVNNFDNAIPYQKSYYQFFRNTYQYIDQKLSYNFNFKLSYSIL